MASMISSQAFSFMQSDRVSPPSSQRLLCSSQSYPLLPFNSIFANRFSKFRKSNRFSLTANASSISAVSEDIISEALGDVSIFTAAGEPVKFKDLWDQNEVLFFSVIFDLISVFYMKFKFN